MRVNGIERARRVAGVLPGWLDQSEVAANVCNATKAGAFIGHSVSGVVGHKRLRITSSQGNRMGACNRAGGCAAAHVAHDLVRIAVRIAAPRQHCVVGCSCRPMATRAATCPCAHANVLAPRCWPTCAGEAFRCVTGLGLGYLSRPFIQVAEGQGWGVWQPGRLVAGGRSQGPVDTLLWSLFNAKPSLSWPDPDGALGLALANSSNRANRGRALMVQGRGNPAGVRGRVPPCRECCVCVWALACVTDPFLPLHPSFSWLPDGGAAVCRAYS